jgi:outer membrane protein OmpA-like peptidoglycan-associated protein
MASGNDSGGSFWVSYSDLATGLMIVFMLVMIIMVVLQKQSNEERTDRLAKIVAKIEIILGQKSKLGESVNKAFSKSNTINADPVTAQLSIDESMLTFSESTAVLKPSSREFLTHFTPKYFCSLWSHEASECLNTGKNCSRIDPENPGGVRRINVTGHADMLGQYHKNHKLSTERAESVTQYMLKILRCADGLVQPDCPTNIKVPGTCEKREGALLAYAEERLWAVGAGESVHCTNELNKLDSPRAVERCDALSRNDPSYRKVNFALELTGDDMTGLLADLVALRKAVDNSEGEQEIDVLADTVAFACWENPHSYHGCRTFTYDCLDSGPEGNNCNPMYSALSDIPDLRSMAKEICRKEELKGCLALNQ